MTKPATIETKLGWDACECELVLVAFARSLGRDERHVHVIDGPIKRLPTVHWKLNGHIARLQNAPC